MASKHAIIVQPVEGIAPDVVADKRLRAVSHLSQFNYEVISDFKVDNVITDPEIKDGILHQDLLYLGMLYGRMSMCDAAYFVDGWQDSPICKKQHEIAIIGGLETIYETPIALLQEKKQGSGLLI